MSNFDNILHFYGQNMWHDEVIISGDEAALTKLRDAINDALSDKNKGISEHFVNDGEGFMCLITKIPNERLHFLRVPYTDECAKDSSLNTCRL